MIDQYRGLADLTDMVYQTDLARMQKLTEEERKLRAALDDLDRQLADGMNPDAPERANWRAIGADQAWRRWLTKQRAETNMRLATLMAGKAEAAQRLKTSFAKKQVSEELLEQQKLEIYRDRLAARERQDAGG